EVGAKLDSMALHQVGELMEPGKVVLAADRLIIVPAEASPPGVDPQLLHHLKVARYLIQIFSPIIIFQDAEGDPFGDAARNRPGGLLPAPAGGGGGRSEHRASGKRGEEKGQGGDEKERSSKHNAVRREIRDER